MADKVIVSPGCSIRYPAGMSAKGSQRPILTQGTEIPDGLFTPTQIREHVKSGFAKVVQRSDQPDPATLPKSIPDRPGETIPPAINSGDPGPSGKGSDPVTTSQDKAPAATPGNIPDVSDEGVGVFASPRAEQPIPGPEVDGAGSEVSPWTFDPYMLAGKPVDELNILIKERDESVEAFETPEEAIAFLSQNFITR